VPDLVPGQLMGYASPAGFPTFGSMAHTAALQMGKVNVFGRTSRRPSLIVHLEAEPACACAASRF
jgi:hypothetical protein